MRRTCFPPCVTPNYGFVRGRCSAGLHAPASLGEPNRHSRKGPAPGPPMKPLFTIHEGEFLVGDYINRKLGQKYDVWVPTKDSGVDLLVTRKKRAGRAVGVQVKFSRSFDIPAEFVSRVIATSWFKLDPAKVRASKAELWVFVILTLRHEAHFVVIPTRELRKRIPRGIGKVWNLYLWVLSNGSCYQVRGLDRDALSAPVHRGVVESQREFSKWLENWSVLDRLSGARTFTP